MTTRTRLQALEKSAPAVRLRAESMSFEDYLALLLTAWNKKPIATSVWLEELTAAEMDRFASMLEQAQLQKSLARKLGA